jgi:hypothetical protein
MYSYIAYVFVLSAWDTAQSERKLELHFCDVFSNRAVEGPQTHVANTGPHREVL